MDATWIAPPAVLTLGAFAVAALVRRLLVAVDDAAAAGRRSGRVEDALIPVRVETRRARASLDRHRHR